MKTLNKYLVYVDNGKQTTSKALVASSKKSVMKSLEGQGDIVAVKNLTEDHIIKAATVRDVLTASGKFDKLELEWIVQTLTLTGMVTDGNPQPEARPAAPEVKPEQKPKARTRARTEQRPTAPKPEARTEQKPAAPKLEVLPTTPKPDVKPMEEKKSA